jgi:CelD/BcsL family acetyltransferase involved in cellulose biosynthesis
MSATLTVSESALRCSVVTDAAQLDALRPAWLDLLERCPTSEVTQTPMWLLPWWRVFGTLDGRRLNVGLFYEGERLIGMAPLLARRHWYRPGLPFRRLEPLGTGERPADRVWSDYVGLLVEPGAEKPIAARFANAMKEGLFGRWDELVLPAQNGADGMAELLTVALRAAGFQTQMVPTSAAPYIALPSTWDAYLQALSSSHRYFIKRSLRDFEKWADGDFQVITATSPEALDEGRRHLVALHTERWQAAGDQGVFQSPLFCAFNEAAQRELLDAGALNLLWLRARGQVVAVLYNLRWNGKVSHYQAGRQTDLPASVRPGVVLHAFAIQRAIGARLREYDFLAGLSRYKSQLAPTTRPLIEIRAARRSLVEGARRLVESAAHGARAVRKGCAWKAAIVLDKKNLQNGEPPSPLSPCIPGERGRG